MGLLTKLAKTAIKAADKTQDINKQMSLDLPEIIQDTPIKTPVVTDDLADEAKEILGNKEAIDNWKKENKVPAKESKRRKQRKFSEQAKDLQAGIMSGPEYRKYIKENQPATSFTPEDLKTMMPNFKEVVGALTKDKSDKGILGLNSSLEKGTEVSARLDIPAYNEYNVWVASIVNEENAKRLYGRTAVLKDVSFDLKSGQKKGKKIAIRIAKDEMSKTPFATMKGKWQDVSDKDAFALAEKYINDPEWTQVGFNPERHSFFYDKETMMPVFNADAVVQIGALVLAKIPKLKTPALRAERLNKLRELKLENMPEGARPATFKEGGLVPMDNQMNFALGGLNDEGGEIDEVSGNRVPIGGTKEGVRDDIEINISEGEFVFPADVVRYHGLDKMMALRQEAKMGLKQMERMGQMGNSNEATIPDDLPFEMADLIVVGGKGEPMKFANGGFVPEMQTLETAPVPTMGGGTSTGTQTPIVYDDFMKTPVVTMQEYRDANGNSIIITSVNGKATTEIPAGYTLYTPPANTAPTTTQAAIQTVNRRSYRPTTGDNEGPEPQPDQPAPDYRNMNDDEFFSYMAEQNGFGAKAGNAAGLAIATMVGGPVGLLVSALMRNNKNNQMANMKSRIDRMDNGPAKTNALALYKEYGGETDPKKKEGLFANIANFVTGLVTPVANTLGINQEDAAKVAQNAAVTEVSGTEPATVAAAPTTSLKPILRPDVSVTAPVTQTGPQGTAIGTFTNQDPRQPTAFPGMGVTTPTITADDGYGPVTNLDVLAEKAERAAQPTAQQLNEARRYNLDMQSTGGQASAKNKLPSGPTDIYAPQAGDTRFGTGQPNFAAEAARRSLVRGDKGVIPTAGTGGYDETGINVQPPQPTEAEQNLAKFQRDQEFKKRYTPTKPNLIREDKPNYTSLAAVQQSYGPSQRAGYESDMYAAMQDMPPVNYVVAPNEAGQENRVLQKQPQASVESSYDEVGVQMQDPRETEGMGSPLSPVVGPTTVSAEETYGPASDRFVSSYSSPDAFQYTAQNLNTQAQREAAALQASPDMFGPIQTQQAFGDTSYIGGTPFIAEQDKRYSIFGDELEPGFKDASLDVAAQQQTAAQARAREAAAQRARIQTRNKEIATATSKIPAYIANSKQTQDSIKAGYVGSTTGGYAIGKISGSDGNEAGVLQRADGKVTKLRDLKGYEGLKGTQRGAMTVFSDAEGTKFVKSTFGKKTKLNGDKYEGPGITQQDKGGTPATATATAKQVTKDGVRYNTSDGSGGTPSKPADPPGNTGGFTSITDMFDGGGPGESAQQEIDRGGGDGSSSRVICTELYKQGKLDRELYRMDVVYTAKHLSPITVRGYHYWAVPMVVKMRSSTLLTNVFKYLTIARAKEIAHIVKPQEYKDRSVLGYIIKNVGEAICYSIGLFTDQKDWTVLYNKGIVK